MTAFQRVLDALNATGHPPRGGGRQYQARCPAHEDRKASLSVTAGTDRVLLKCHAGCDNDDVVAALKLTRSDLFDEPRTTGGGDDWTPCGHGIAVEYPYVDEHGRTLFTVVRCPQKDFAQYRPDPTAKSGRRWKLDDTRRVLYRLPEVLAAVHDNRPVWLVEGEKDANRLAALGVTATCNPHGAGKWRDDYTHTLAGATVTIVADRDDPGRAHADTVAAGLRAAGCDVRVVEAASGKDVSEHLDAGHTLDDLITTGTEPATEPDPPATWTPVDLTHILEGTYVPETAVLMPRTDGQHLLYAGRVHSFHGESESGKSFLAQAETARILTDDGHVLYIDYESDGAAVVGRLLELGAPPDAIKARFTYVQPEVSPFATDAEAAAWVALLDGRYDLAVIDGVTDALGTNGVKSNDNDEIAAWCRRVARPIARKTGAAVILVDHVTKDPDSRGRFALGGQAKMNALDGAAYVIEVVDALGRGLCGTIAMRIAKDRPGGVRAHCGAFRKMDRTQEAARIVIDSRTPNAIKVTVEPPTTGSSPSDGKKFRPTHIMERVSLFLQVNGPTSLSTIRKSVTGRATIIDFALGCLREEGHVTVADGKQSARIYTLQRAYLEAADPLVTTPSDPVPDHEDEVGRPQWSPNGTEADKQDPVLPVPPCPDPVPDGVGAFPGDPVPPTPPPTGWDGVAEAPQRSTTTLDPVPAPTCIRCGWPLGSSGHASNCQEGT